MPTGIFICECTIPKRCSSNRFERHIQGGEMFVSIGVGVLGDTSTKLKHRM
jgi:hypothetical protein